MLDYWLALTNRFLMVLLLSKELLLLLRPALYFIACYFSRMGCQVSRFWLQSCMVLVSTFYVDILLNCTSLEKLLNHHGIVLSLMDIFVQGNLQDDLHLRRNLLRAVCAPLSWKVVSIFFRRKRVYLARGSH